MSYTQTLSLFVLTFLAQSVAWAHEGLHAAGQVHAGENHIGLLEISLAVLATILLVAYQVHKHKSKK